MQYDNKSNQFRNRGVLENFTTLGHIFLLKNDKGAACLITSLSVSISFYKSMRLLHGNTGDYIRTWKTALETLANLHI